MTTFTSLLTARALSLHMSRNGLNGHCLIAHKSESQDCLHMEIFPQDTRLSVAKAGLQWCDYGL